MRFRSAFLIAALSVSPCVWAQDMTETDPYGPPDPNQELPLDGEALRALFIDRLHRGYYQDGDWETLDPAFTERMHSDGGTVHERDEIVSKGTWRTRDNVVCFEYDNLRGGCFTMYQRGNCYYAFSAYTSELVAISVLDGEIPSCEPSVA